MKIHTFVLFSSFQTLVWASPEPEPLPIPEPQRQGNSGYGQLVLGSVDSNRSNENCRCTKKGQKCQGTKCECANQSSVECWMQQKGACTVQLQTCPSQNGQIHGQPTPPNSNYKGCGEGFPSCRFPRQCRRVDPRCQADPRSCLGLCLPDPTQPEPPPMAPQPMVAPWGQQPQPQQPNPPWIQPQQPSPPYSPPYSPPPQQPPRPPPPPPPPPPQMPPPATPAPNLPSSKCPVDFKKCIEGYFCVMDPRDPGTPICIIPGKACGGKSGGCDPGEDCVPDPRVKCQGKSCPGVCA